MPHKIKRSPRKRRMEKQVFEAFIPFILMPLVRARIITAEHLKAPEALWKIFYKHFRKGLKKMELCTSIDENFLEHGVEFWRRGQQYVAVVLYATAVEQYTNLMYQNILVSQGWTGDQISSLLREVSVDAKLDWMFEVFTKQRFPTGLKKRLRTVFAIRNAIVHFKGQAAHPDLRADSYSKIQTQMKGLRRMSISRDFRLLTEIFWEALLSRDPDRRIVLEAAELLMQEP